MDVFPKVPVVQYSKGNIGNDGDGDDDVGRAPANGILQHGETAAVNLGAWQRPIDALPPMSPAAYLHSVGAINEDGEASTDVSSESSATESAISHGSDQDQRAPAPLRTGV